MRIHSPVTIVLLATLLGPPRAVAAPSLSAAEKAAAALITEAEISGHIRFLADDLLEGRFPGARGDELALHYLATQLETMGYRPGTLGADGHPAWFQRVPLEKFSATLPQEVTFRRGAEQLSLATGPGVKADVALRSVGSLAEVALQDAE